VLGLAVGIMGKRVIEKQFGKTVKAVEARSDAAKAA
jgi:hypothetical protein